MVAAVTVADTAWGIARRGVIADIAGLEVALALAVMRHRARQRALGGVPPRARLRGRTVAQNYDGRGGDRVLMSRRLA